MKETAEAKKTTVLIADDNADMLAYIKTLLEKNYNVITAVNGRDALHKINEQQPNLILGDIMMPTMDGTQLVKAVKQNPATARIPVIFLSSRAGDEARVEGYDVGADDYLVKPFATKELLSRVRLQLNIAKVRDEADEYMQTIFRQAPAAIAVLQGPEHKYVLANAVYQTMTNRIEEQLVGKTIKEVFPELAGAGTIEIFDNIFNKGETFSMAEYPVAFDKNNDGVMRQAYFNFTAEPVKDEEGKVTSIMVVAIDITEQIEAKKKIEESEHRYSNMIYSSPSMICILKGKDLIIEIANDAIIETWGKGKDVIGKPLLQVLPEIVEQGLEIILSNVYKTGNPYHAYDLPIQLLRNGKMETSYYTFVYQAQRNINGEIEGVAVIANEVTAQAEFNKKIRESEQQFHTLANNIQNFAWIADGDGWIYWYNQRWYDYTGTTLEEMKGWGWEKVHHCDHINRVVEFVKHAWEKNEPWELTFPLRNAEGKYRWFLTRAFPVTDAEGKIIRWIGTNTDIEEQKTFAEKLEEQVNERTYQLKQTNEELLYTNQTNEHAEQTGMFGSYRYNFNTRQISYSNNMYRLLGCEPQEFVAAPKNFMKYVHPDDVQYVLNATQEAFKQKHISQWEYRIIRKDGKIIWVRGTGKIITDNENVQFMIGTLQDITVEKEQEQIITEANEALQNANQQISISKYNKRFLTEFSEKFSSYKPHNEFFNSLVLYIADLTKMDYVLVGKLKQMEKNDFVIQTIAIAAFKKLTDNINYPLPNGPCEQVIRGTLYSYPEKCRITFPKNQTLVQFNVEGYIGYPLFDLQGNAVGLIAVMHETGIEDAETITSILKITAKRAEIELERIKYEEDLEKNNKALEEKNIALEKMNKELESFTYVSSHDLQEPLRKIQTFINMLQSSSGDKDAAGKYLEKISSSANRMQRLIRDVLNYSRIAQSDEQFTETDLNEIIENVKRDFELLIEEKQAVVKYKNLPTTKGIPLQLSQLFSNLISNALKFSNKKPVININAGMATNEEVKSYPQLNPQKKYHHIVFKDNGIGFEQEYAEQIFAIFQRLHNKQDYSGTGIGLALVKKIIENHFGAIAAQGKVNKGARFDIYLPA